MPPTRYRSLVDDLFREIRGQSFHGWVMAERDRDRSWRRISEDLSKLTDGRIDVTHAWLHDQFRDETTAAA